MPDMSGQKLMATRINSDVVKSIFFPKLLVFVFSVFAFTLPFIAVTSGSTNGITDPEMAFVAVFSKHLPSYLLTFVVLMFLIPYLSLVSSNQNWGGSLLVQNFYKYYIKPNASESNLKNAGILVMVLLTIIAGGIAFYADSLMGMVKYMFSITAGVGPVFILRWYWWRINAWSQFSAMLAALIFPTIYDLLFEYNSGFYSLINHLSLDFNMELYPIKLIILTVFVCICWLLVTFLTPKTDAKTIANFVKAVKPGGLWPNELISGKVFIIKRLIAWIMLSVNGFIVYILYWQFLTGEYFLFFILLIVFLINFILAYRVLIKTNKGNATSS
jgi:Na+/proline symporter